MIVDFDKTDIEEENSIFNGQDDGRYISNNIPT